MEPKPVQESRTPRYPTRREVLAGAAAFVVANVIGCSKRVADIEPGPTIAAPIFEHGKGRGSIGCIVVTPAVFLSEEEAIQIIYEELAKNSVHLTTGASMKDLRVAPGIVVVPSYDPCRPLEPSGIDLDKRIVVRFVGLDYYSREFANSTLICFDGPDASKRIAARMTTSGAGPKAYLGVFYDPVVYRDFLRPTDKEWVDDKDERRETEVKIAKTEAKKLVGLQVKDFVAWLNEQKVI